MADRFVWRLPPPRFVDWSIFVIVVLEAASGLVSFTIGSPRGWPLFWFHRIAGLALIGFLALKLARVRRRLTSPDEWQRSTVVSVLAVIAVFGTIVTGIAWVSGLDARLSYWTLLSIHVGFGLVLVPLMILHLSTRFRLPRREDVAKRRSMVASTGLLVGGAIVYRGQELANGVFGTPGADRRFTGSQPREGTGNAGFPSTSWVADDPEPIDSQAWTLTVAGELETPRTYAYEDLEADETTETLLDCTSGWYTVRRWRGRRVGDMLDDLGVGEDARYVRFRSVTGYRWSLPVDEARDALLATHVDDERLDHGHGAPLRLVAPGRRGFQWVKWIERIEVRRRGDPAQWFVTLISGFG